MQILKKDKENTHTTIELINDYLEKASGTRVAVACNDPHTIEDLFTLKTEVLVICDKSAVSSEEFSVLAAKYTRDNLLLLHGNHKLKGLEQSSSDRFSTHFPVEIFAHTAKMMTLPLQKCLAISVYVLEKKMINYGETVLATAGEESGLNTVALIRPAYYRNLIDSKIVEIICKTYD